MINEDTGDALTFLFIVLSIVWTLAIIVLNLPKVIGSALFYQLGKFPFNIVTFCVLWLGGIILLIAGFRAIFRILDKKADKELKENS